MYAAHVLSFIYRYIMDAKTSEKKIFKKKTDTLVWFSQTVLCVCNKIYILLHTDQAYFFSRIYKNVVCVQSTSSRRMVSHSIQLLLFMIWTKFIFIFHSKLNVPDCIRPVLDYCVETLCLKHAPNDTRIYIYR